MEKGIIVEHKKRYTIVMDKQGMFHKVPAMKEAIGKEVTYQPINPTRTPIFFLSVNRKWKWAAMLFLCLLICSPIYFWLTENDAYAVVSIDLNPSMNLTINRNFEVLTVEAVNEDAEEIVSENDLNGQSITAFTDQLLQLARSDPGPNEKKAVLVAISYLKEEADLAIFEEELSSYFDSADYTLTIYEVPPDLCSKAKTEHISMNKVMADFLNKKDSVTEDAYTSLDDEEKELIRYYYHYHPSLNEEETTEKAVNDITEMEKGKNKTKEKKAAPSTGLPSKKNPSAEIREKDNPVAPDQEKGLNGVPDDNASETGKENAKKGQQRGSRERNKEKNGAKKENHSQDKGIKSASPNNKKVNKHPKANQDNASKKGREKRNKE